MADLKYFIRPSQGFRAGDGYVEGCMMAGKEAEAGVGAGGGPMHFAALCSNNGPNAVHLRRQQNGLGLKG